jgi:hypothetical protein
LLCTQIHPNGETDTLKVVISNSRWVALKQCLIPLAPLPISIAVVTLNFIQYFAWDGTKHSTKANGEILNAFQFVGSAYATLIVASTAAIVLHRLRYELLEENGIPLGCILTGYQLNNVKPLATKEFWAGLLQGWPRKARLRHISFVILIVWALLTVNLAHAMAAIAVVPKPGWWDVGKASTQKESKKENTTTLDRIFISNSTELWPAHLTAGLVPDGSCTTSNATFNESCPAGGYPTISETTPNWNAMAMGIWNITFFNDDASRNLASWFTESSVAYTSSLGQILTRSLANSNSWLEIDWRLTMTRKGPYPLFMPFVAVYCDLSPSDSPIVEIPYYNLVNDTRYPGRWVSNDSYFLSNDTRTSKPVQFTWVDLPKSNDSPSLGTAFRLNQDNVVFLNQTLHNPIFACSVDAYWQPVEPSMEPFEGTVVTPTLSSGNVTRITIDAGWAQALNVPLLDSNLTTMESIINYLAYEGQDWGIESFRGGSASAIGLMVTDGIARLGWNHRFAYTLQHDPNLYTLTNNGTLLSLTALTNLNPDWVELEIKVSRNGYSYSVKTITVKIAITILLLHGLVAVVHTVVICCFRHPWTSQSWGTVGELVLLALNSRLRGENPANASMATESQKWSQPLRVREIEEGHLEIIIGDAQGNIEGGTLISHEKVHPGKAYS